MGSLTLEFTTFIRTERVDLLSLTHFYVFFDNLLSLFRTNPKRKTEPLSHAKQTSKLLEREQKKLLDNFAPARDRLILPRVSVRTLTYPSFIGHALIPVCSKRTSLQDGF